MKTVSGAEVLANIAYRLFTVLPNSMVDERTGSWFTWQNSGIRNAPDAHSMLDMRISIFGTRTARVPAPVNSTSIKYRKLNIDKTTGRRLDRPLKKMSNGLSPKIADRLEHPDVTRRVTRTRTTGRQEFRRG